MKINYILYHVIAVAFVGKVAARLFYSEGPKLTFTYNTPATITFYSNFSAYPDHVFKTMFIEEDKSGKSVAAGGLKAFAVQGTDTHFGNRISVRTEGEKYILQLSKTELTDNVNITATAVYQVGTKAITNIQAKVELFVLGGPFKCAGEMTKDLKVVAGKTATLNMTLCGEPIPKVNWTMDSKLIGTNAHQKLGPAKNNFVLTLNNINASHCGRDVVFMAVGYSTPNIQEKTKLHVSYKPAGVLPKYNYHVNTTCVRTVWHKSDIGLCTDLTYEVAYLNSEGGVIDTVSVKHPKTEHSYCKGDITKITDIKIRGRTATDTGVWKTEVMLATDPTAEKQTQLTENDDWETGAIIGGVIGGVALIVIIIIIICCCCCTQCLVCCGCKDDKKTAIHTDTNTFGKYKKNSRKKQRSYIVEDAVAPGVNPVYVVDSSAPPTDSSNVYATSTKSTLKKKTEPEFFDPTEFGIKPDKTAEITSQYNNTTYIDDDDEEEYQNKPSMLI